MLLIKPISAPYFNSHPHLNSVCGTSIYSIGHGDAMPLASLAFFHALCLLRRVPLISSGSIVAIASFKGKVRTHFLNTFT